MTGSDLCQNFEDDIPFQFSPNFLYDDEDDIPHHFNYDQNWSVRNPTRRSISLQSPTPSRSFITSQIAPPANQFVHDRKASSFSSPDFSSDHPVTEYPPSQICRYFVQGYCSRGDKCHFIHMNDGPVTSSQKQKVIRHGKRTEEPVKHHKNMLMDSDLQKLEGQICDLARDQNGCRFLQKRLDESPEAHLLIFSQVLSSFSQLMVDPFGNYLCQKVFESSTPDQRSRILQYVSKDLLFISLDLHGTRAVQKLIENSHQRSQLDIIITCLSADPMRLIKDINGNHVIQKCLKHLSDIDKQFIFDAVLANCVNVAKHRQGCCVMQRCIDSASYKQRCNLIAEIANKSLALVQDAFGNYVVQYVLELGDSLFTEWIINQFLGNICFLSEQKFSSNVIEKVL
jgi:hypothetical protein